ncbi:MAG: hypothetical protein ACN4E2_06135 [Nitrospinota bacterium]
MEIHRQTCQSCGNRKALNILVRQDGKSDKVYVQCLACKELMATYLIGPRGYYHHGKGFESYSRGINRGGHYESAKEMTDDFNKIQEVAIEEFKNVAKIVLEKELTDKNEST